MPHCVMNRADIEKFLLDTLCHKLGAEILAQFRNSKETCSKIQQMLSSISSE